MKEKINELYSMSILACSNDSNSFKSYSYAVLSNKELYEIVYSLEKNEHIINLIRTINEEEYDEIINLINDLDLIGPFQFITGKADSLYSIHVNYNKVNKTIKSFCGTDEEPGIYNHVFNLLASFANYKTR